MTRPARILSLALRWLLREPGDVPPPCLAWGLRLELAGLWRDLTGWRR